MFEDELECERICQNCGSFFQSADDEDYGICMMDEEFEPYLDEIIEKEDFSCCSELFLRKRIHSLNEACELFEEVEFIDIPEDMDEKTYNKLEALQNADVSDIINYLYNDDMEIAKSALSQISIYVNIGNLKAVNDVIEYYLSLAPAKILEDVYFRKDIIEILKRYESDERIIKAYVKELERTPSNNTTRQLYSLILDRLKWCNYEIVADLLYELLDKKEYRAKLQKRIIDTIENNYTAPKNFPF